MSNSWPPLTASGGLIANRYHLLESLGEGGFGEVFKAEDTKFDPPRAVAVKVLHRSFLADPQVRDAIKREASVLARFSHPNILRVLDFEVSPSQAYIVTELAAKGSLAQLLRPDPALPPVALPPTQAMHYLEQLVGALDEAHSQGLIHRDIKPENILLDRSNRVLLADFGLALTVNSSRGSLSPLGSGGVWGTAEYAAPEVWDEKVSKATDIYALGVLLYQMLTGQMPFQGTPAAVMRQHLDSPVPRLSARAPWLDYPPVLDEVIAHAMAKTPADRPRNAVVFYRLVNQAITQPLSLPGKFSANRPAFPANPHPQAPYPAPPVTPPWRPQPAPPPLGSSFRSSQMAPGGYGPGQGIYQASGWEEGLRLVNLVRCLIYVIIGFTFSPPKTATEFYRRGTSLAQLELFQLAINSYSQAIKLEPDFAVAYRSRGIAYKLKGNLKKARRDLEKAAQLGDDVARQELGQI